MSLLANHTFVVFDTETTGMKPDEDRVIEIGAVKLVNGEEVARFSQLINPGRFIPKFITEITGISTAMLVDQPPPEVVLMDFLAFAGDAVLVAHNLSFDDGFISAELERAELPALEHKKLCTLRLARRLLPRLPSRGLKNLANHFGIRIVRHHCATADAEATAKIFVQLVRSLETEFHVATIDDAVRFQYKSYAQTKGEPKHISGIREKILPQIPELPGVYRMYDRSKRLIYVGKARRLRDRVTSYFRAIENHPKKTQNLVREVRDIKWDVLPSELDALLMESKLIKQHLPKFNRALVRYKNAPFLCLNSHLAFPTIGWKYVVQNDGAEYFGPLANREQAEQTMEWINHLFRLRECDEVTFSRRQVCIYHEMGRCEGPCAKPDAARVYPEHVQMVRNFLLGENESVRLTLEHKMKKAASTLAFEEARGYRDQLQMFDRILQGRKHMAAPVREHNGAFVLWEDRALLVHLVRFGKKAETLRFSAEGWPTEQVQNLLAAVVADHFSEDRVPPERYGQKEVDEIRILAHWMYCNRGRFHQIPFTRGMSLSDFLLRIREVLEQVRTAPALPPTDFSSK
ncbi:MAG: DEDD exonuclease domain-containing protein [Rhodothermia bacterium]|nr:DEDD exonuclease domain-containing protein [Rhodothermia bacterium]